MQSDILAVGCLCCQRSESKISGRNDASYFHIRGEMGMPTDQIAKVFKMDASEVVKILEQAERSTSKDGVDVGNGRDNEMISLLIDCDEILIRL